VGAGINEHPCGDTPERYLTHLNGTPRSGQVNGECRQEPELSTSFKYTFYDEEMLIFFILISAIF
jgi:hypothetical protein